MTLAYLSLFNILIRSEVTQIYVFPKLHLLSFDLTQLIVKNKNHTILKAKTIFSYTFQSLKDILLFIF